MGLTGHTNPEVEEEPGEPVGLSLLIERRLTHFFN